MTDMAVVITSTKNMLREIATQAKTLGVGLQNAAPGNKSGAPNYSVQYLVKTSENFSAWMEECDKLSALPHTAKKEQKESISKLARTMLAEDKALRDQFQIGDKFRFIRDRTQAVVTKIDESMLEMQQEERVYVKALVEDEVEVYVYLYNSHGLSLKTWVKMVNPSVYYEYSVNRPVYVEKAHIQQVIRNKTNKMQHAFLTIAVKKTDILPTTDEALRDPVGHPLVKVKEGALHAEKLIAFTHNDMDYVVDHRGELIKKE
ncbi:MAG TPA: type IVB secretion system protein IcmQ [Gammaproteobacteria bacterium]|jgi:hypothetical protein|nr:type IVB secretion system protein IcmQ [Gammaproteobacteria bacterium]